MLSKKSVDIKSSAVRELLKFSKIPGFISLAGGIPAIDLIDIEGIDIILQNILSRDHKDLFQYSVTEGEENLRSQISIWNNKNQFTIDPNNIIITSGSQQAIDLLNRVFLEKDDIVLVERPTYLAALQLFQYTDTSVVELNYTDNKIDLNALEDILKKGKVKMLYLTPNFSNPTGQTIDLKTRHAIVELTYRFNTVVIEDDPYGSLNFNQNHIPSLYSIAQKLYGADHNICYISSFSKIFSPGLRLGWIATSPKFLFAITVVKQSLDLHTSTFNQIIAADYLESGRLDNRLNLLKSTYKARRDLLIDALNIYLVDSIKYNKPDGGMFLWCHLNNNINSRKLLKESIKQKVIFVPGEVFFAKNPELNSLRLSYSMISQQDADIAVSRIAKALGKLA